MPAALTNTPLASLRGADGTRVLLRGGDGLAALGGSGAGATWSAEALVADYAGVAVGALRTDPVSASLPAALAAATAVLLLMTVEGDVGVRREDRVVPLPPGALRLVRDGDALVTGTASIAWLALPAHRLAAAPAGPVAEGPLAVAVAALLRRLAMSPAVLGRAEQAHLARALVELVAALLPGGEPEPDDRAAVLRRRAREHIEHHLGDPGLGPQQIAAALGVSVGWLHRAFSEDGATVARTVRERRLDAVAEALRSARRPESPESLAERFGFSGRDALARAFRERHGVSMQRFRQGADDPRALLDGTRLPG